MKNLIVLALSLVTVASFADFRPGRVRPEMRGQLNITIGSETVPTLNILEKNFMDGKREAVSFTLTEDTGIRCVTVPCPSTKKAIFKIEDTQTYEDSVVYTAVEVLGRFDHRAPRTLTVKESYMELINVDSFSQRVFWVVEIRGIEGSMFYTANPEYLAVTL